MPLPLLTFSLLMLKVGSGFFQRDRLVAGSSPVLPTASQGMAQSLGEEIRGRGGGQACEEGSLSCRGCAVGQGGGGAALPLWRVWGVRDAEEKLKSRPTTSAAGLLIKREAQQGHGLCLWAVPAPAFPAQVFSFLKANVCLLVSC